MMKLTYYGTGAAEGIPALFCNCSICQNALANRGKEVRTRSQATVDDRLLIDLPPDTYLHVLHGGLDLRPIRSLLLTHSHSDHLYERELWCRREHIAYGIGEEPLSVYATASVLDRVRTFLSEKMPGSGRIALCEVKPFQPFWVEGYTVTALAATHAPDAGGVIYEIEGDGRRLLYAHDTGLLPEETWVYLTGQTYRYDLLSLDCTGGLLPTYPRSGHMCLAQACEVVARLRAMGRCDAASTVCLNHISHNGGATHKALAAAAAAHGFAVAYDGMKVEI